MSIKWRNINVGDKVEALTRDGWKLGLVKDVRPGKDGGQLNVFFDHGTYGDSWMSRKWVKTLGSEQFEEPVRGVNFDANAELGVALGEHAKNYVTWVKPASPAYMAGVKIGWCIVAVNGEEVDTYIEGHAKILLEQAQENGDVLNINFGIQRPIANPTFPVNSRVKLDDGRVGTVMYVGGTHWGRPGAVWYGIKLRRMKGKHDGKVRGRRYFMCKPGYGVFVKRGRILCELPEVVVNVGDRLWTSTDEKRDTGTALKMLPVSHQVIYQRDDGTVGKVHMADVVRSQAGDPELAVGHKAPHESNPWHPLYVPPDNRSYSGDDDPWLDRMGNPALFAGGGDDNEKRGSNKFKRRDKWWANYYCDNL